VLRLIALLGIVCAVPAQAAQKPKGPRRATPPTPAAAVQRLGRGYALYIEGDYDGARKELAKLDVKQLLNRDYALYLRAQSELLSGDADTARKLFKDVAATGGRFQNLARWRIADCDYAAGRLEDARKAYESVLPVGGDDLDAAVARYRIAEALDKRGGRNAALAAYRKVYIDYPMHPLAERAKERLTALDAPPITVEEKLSRARTLTANRAWTRSLEELATIGTEVTPQLRDETDHLFAMTKFKMRRDYDVAAQKLMALWPRMPGEDKKADALFHGARAWSRADKDDLAIAGYKEMVAKFPRARQASEASFLIGWLEFNRAKYKDAIAALEDTLKRYGASQWEDDARWYLGFSRYLAGDFPGALADFDKLAKKGKALSGGKGDYWAGKALAKLNKNEEAQARWRALVSAYPFSYYAASARARLKEAGIDVPPFGDSPRAGRVPPLGEIEPALEADPLIVRADELLKAGLSVEAGWELRRGDGDFLKRYGSQRALPVLFDRYTKAESWKQPFRTAEALSGAALRMDPQADPLVRRWWEQVYPRAYRPFIEKYAPSGNNPPYYLYTIMQKESAYNPHDVSYADAIGLLQMIPPTSRKVALRIDYPYTDDVLYDPEGNIRFGAWYIGHLLGKFKTQIPLGAGSYNAGPKAMSRWLEKNGQRPLDEFIELCSYTQTREYMKKVVDIYARYVWLYEKEDYLPPAKIDPVPLDDGLDY
jgi:soluble lytic murein transglycosylase